MALALAALMLCGCATSHRDNVAAFRPQLLVREPISSVVMTNDGNLQWRVRIKVNGVQGLFALDTGSETTILSREFTDKIGLLEGSKPGHFVGRNLVGQQVRYAKLDVVDLGQLSFLNFYAPVMSLDHINRFMLTKIDGILGNNLLSQAACRFDWRKNVLTLDAGTPVRPTNAIDVIQLNSRPYIIAQLNGKNTRLELDTGSYSTCLNDAQIEKLKIAPAKKMRVEAPRIDISEAGRGLQTRIILDSVEFCGVARKDFPMMTWDYNVLGMDLLENWILSYDARNGWMALTDYPP